MPVVGGMFVFFFSGKARQKRGMEAERSKIIGREGKYEGFAGNLKVTPVHCPSFHPSTKMKEGSQRKAKKMPMPIFYVCSGKQKQAGRREKLPTRQSPPSRSGVGISGQKLLTRHVCLCPYYMRDTGIMLGQGFLSSSSFSLSSSMLSVRREEREKKKAAAQQRLCLPVAACLPMVPLRRHSSESGAVGGGEGGQADGGRCAPAGGGGVPGGQSASKAKRCFPSFPLKVKKVLLEKNKQGKGQCFFSACLPSPSLMDRC